MTAVEITAIYRSERFRFDNLDGDVVIADADYVDGPRPNGVPQDVAIKGPCCEFERGQTYRLYGRWSSYRNRRTGVEEQQFHYQTAIQSQPHSKVGVIKYLEAAGKGNGVGRAKATLLWERFGSDAVKVLREQPDVAAEAIKGLSLESAQMTSLELQRLHHVEHCSIELMQLLDRRGFPKATAKRCLDLWGNQAAAIVQRNPYLLMRFRGCGFKLTDAMWIDLGHPPGRLKRQALCAWHKIASDTTGHTWFPAEFAIQGIRENVSGAELQPVDALKLAKRAAMLETIRTNGRDQFVEAGGQVWVAEAKKARNERYVAHRLVDAMTEFAQWPTVDIITQCQPRATTHQMCEIHAATRGAIGLFGGSPGTGKTYMAAALVQAIQRCGGKVAVAAPTGKAAVRVTEALQANGVSIRAKTIHSLLGVEMDGISGGGWSFKYREGNPLPLQYLVVDEVSMLDVDLLSSLLAARSPGTHILFVGDVNQLPPVGHGAPLRDMIAAGLPYGELREIQRNSGRIVQACAEMRDGQRFSCSPAVDLEAGENLYEMGGNSPQEILTTLSGVFEYVKTLGFDEVWDCQVVVPVNAKSELSRQRLNVILQEQLNDEPGVKGIPFRVCDKIVNTKNGFFGAVELDDSDEDVQVNDRGEVYVANGELGRVVVVEPKLIVAKLDNPSRTIRIPRGGSQNGEESSTGCSWELGYALSVHKSQGSEWPVVIVVLDEYPGARMVCDRAWVYTAISRAKQLCLLLGKVETAHRFCRTTKIDERQTFLKQLIRHEQSTRLLVNI